MSSSRSLSSEQNERVRESVGVLLERFGTQTELARQLGVSQGALSQFLLGKTGAGIKLVSNVARLLGVPVNDLLQEVPASDEADDGAPAPGEKGVKAKSPFDEPVDRRDYTTLAYLAEISLAEISGPKGPGETTLPLPPSLVRVLRCIDEDLRAISVENDEDQRFKLAANITFHVTHALRLYAEQYSRTS